MKASCMVAGALALTGTVFGVAGGELSEAEKQGRALVADLLAERPTEGLVKPGVLKVRDRAGARREVPVRCEVLVTATNWQSVYETLDDPTNRVRLVVVHRGGQPSEYLLTDNRTGDTNGARPRTLVGSQTMVPFAGSDFWVADLGLEFLHWPAPRILKKEMRRSRFCRVLETTNPDPGPDQYRRVLAWLDSETSGIVHAEAFDEKNKLLKEFEPKDFQKVNGRWELKEMRIRNVRTGSQTVIAFDLDEK